MSEGEAERRTQAAPARRGGRAAGEGALAARPRHRSTGRAGPTKLPQERAVPGTPLFTPQVRTNQPAEPPHGVCGGLPVTQSEVRGSSFLATVIRKRATRIVESLGVSSTLYLKDMNIYVRMYKTLLNNTSIRF